MRKTFLKAFGSFACLAWSGMACAVGFGGINVTSSLGQPLVAEIELVAVEKADKSGLNAHLATPEAFKGAGIDYPYSLPKLKFHVETRANGEPYIKATSEQPINEPFVSLLIELGWSSGRLLREYTFLLDPPGFVAEQPAVAAVKPIEPVVVAPVIASAPVAASAPQAEPELQVASAPVVASAPEAAAEVAPAPVAEVVKQSEPVAATALPPAEVEPVPFKPGAKITHVASDSITVKRGDTLSKIANKTKASDVSLERMLVALYRANAEAFDGNNMNRLRVGKILHMPEAEALAKLQQSEAANEVHAQVSDWNAYRQKLAAANAPTMEQRPKQEVAGKISTSIADKAPAVKESAKEVLKLSKGEALGDQAAAGGKAKSAKDKAIAKEEDSIAKAKALKEAEQRTALLEKSVKDMQRLVELKNQAAAARAGQNGAASAPASALPLAASAVAPASTVAAASAVVVAKPKPVAPKVVAAPSLIDDILGNPIYLGGGAAVLLGLGGLGFMRLRGAKKVNTKKPSKVEDAGSATGRIAAPVMPSPETGDFTSAVAASTVATGTEEVDPIGEADMFLNFGRDVQAEEVLKDALHKDPSNNPVKLKLLSIYASRKDTKSFYVYALEIKESGDEAAWAQAAAMGQALEPNNALYGGAGEPAVSVAEGDAALPSVDFDLGFGESPAPTIDIHSEMEPAAPAGEQTVIMSASEMVAAQEEPMDFDVTGTHPGLKAAASEEPTLDIPAMDFDVTGTQQGANGGMSEEPKLDIAAMDFDVTSTHPGVKVSASEEPKLDMPSMDFDMGSLQLGTQPAAQEVAVEQAPALDLNDLVFEVPAAQAPAAPSVSVEPVVAEADKGMAFTIDFPSDLKADAAAKPVAPAKDVGLGEISLSLDDLPAPAKAAVSEPKDEHWQEVATKLDLAKAYQEMGDQDGAREILEEVVRDGDETQRETAQALLQQLI